MRNAASPLDLERDGATVVPQVLDEQTIADLAAMADEQLAAQPDEHFEAFRFHGSMLPLDLGDALARRLVGWDVTLDTLERLGYAAPKWLSGYVISKPPRSPSLWWHQDWWAWDEPESFGTFPPQLFVMYYLTDVDASNGCLRIIPGSHRGSHRLHHEVPEAHSAEIAASDLAGLAHRRQADEVSVEVKAGDAVIGDVRVLHATHANTSGGRRTCLTLWYLPDYESLSDALKAYVMTHPAQPQAGWWREPADEITAELGDLLPVYDGDAPPAAYNRTPPERWPVAV